jgi:predicted MFS family arabinose efflux permease
MNNSAAGVQGRAEVVFLGLRKAAPNGEIARVLLAFLATAGLFYVNIMPALVDGLIQGAGFSNRQAGLVGSSNVYGAALGALAAVFLVKRINWRKAAYGLLVGLIGMDLLSLLVQHFEPLLVMRFAHGVVGGLLVGIGFSIIARTTQADRTFGYLLLVQVGLGGLGLMVLPPLVPVLGTGVLFGALILFSLVTLLMVPFLGDYPVDTVSKRAAEPGQGIARVPLALSLLATFLFQAGNMAVYAYVIGLGEAAGLTMDFISPVLGVANWIAIIGSGLVIVFSTRYGRALPLGAAVVLAVGATWALHFSYLNLVYVLANCLIGITWAFGIPYLLGMCAEFDKSGQMAALGGFASKMGLASGPLVAALVVGTSNYSLVIDLGAATLAVSLIAALLPSRLLDRAGQPIR